jgi:hypothetical protein
MPNGHGETAADYAWAAASDAGDDAKEALKRLKHLEQLLIEKGIITRAELQALYPPTKVYAYQPPPQSTHVQLPDIHLKSPDEERPTDHPG